MFLGFLYTEDSIHSSLVALESFLFVGNRDMEVALNKIGMSMAMTARTNWVYFHFIPTITVDSCFRNI